MDGVQFNMEMAAFDSNIALAELEASKADQRVKELKYNKTRFVMEVLQMQAKASQPEGSNGTPDKV